MSFLETVRRARTHLEDQGRVSLRGLKREFDLDEDGLEALVGELVDVQQVAAREGKLLAWIGVSPPAAPAPAAAEASASVALAPPAAEPERRHLTVMFCDLVGSADLSQRIDAEDLRSVVRDFQKVAVSVIERHEGHIAQYLGDGLLVYFGHPLAHEDDAERAVRAGREILTALDRLNDRLEPQLGIRLAVRVGIHTGTVVMSVMGAGEKSETLALGDTTIIAARLEHFAESNSVVISEETLRLVPGLFVTKDLGTQALRGISEPMRVYAVLQATGVRSRLVLDPSRLTPLVGREAELELLCDRWEKAKEGESQGVLVSGEAGIGKSRLLQTFREQLAETPHGWLECRCSPYTQGSAFQPFVELIEQGLAFKEGDDPEERLERLERGVELAGLDVCAVVPLVAPLLSLPLSDRYPPLRFSPGLQRTKTIEALVSWIVHLARLQPLVMLVEDLHWADSSTVDLLSSLLAQIPSARVLTLLSFRTEFEPPWSAGSHLTPLAVERLSRVQIVMLVVRMTGDTPLPDAAVERLVERADGVPLFAEELTKMMLESDFVEKQGGRYELTGPLTEHAVPVTLKDLLMARLDRLDAGKEVAQLGAILGREFCYELLQNVSLQEEPRLRAGLEQLVAAGLLYRRGRLPRADFTFKHALIQDTAYQSLLKSTRRQFHARVARVLEERFPERVAAEPEVVARHCEEAGLTEQAIGHYARAGGSAKRCSASEQAIGLLKRAIALLATLPETPGRDQQELGLQLAIAAPLSAARSWSDPECAAAYERARELASGVGETPELSLVLSGLAASFQVKGDLETATELARQALAAAERSGDALHRVAAHAAAGYPLFWQGEFSRALRHFERAVALHDLKAHASLAHTLGVDQGVNSHVLASGCLWMLGYPDQAMRRIERAVALAKEVDHPLSLAQALTWTAIIHLMRRESALTRERAEEAIELAEPLGFPVYVGTAHSLRGWARGGLEGVAEIQQGIGIVAQTGMGIGAPQCLAMLGESAWKVGHHDDALGALAFALAESQRMGQHYHDAELHRLRGEILLDRGEGETGEAETLFRRALEVARGQQARLFELRAATCLARLLRTAGRQDEARALLAPVYEGFTEGFETQDLKDAKTMLGSLPPNPRHQPADVAPT